MDDKDAWLDDVRRWYFGGTEPPSYRHDPDPLTSPPAPLPDAAAAAAGQGRPKPTAAPLLHGHPASVPT